MARRPDMRAQVLAEWPRLRDELERLIRVPSVSLEGYPREELERAAKLVADLLTATGMPHVRLLDVGGSAPAVYASRPARRGAPTVLLYAHYDVQPVGDLALWTSDPFTPSERDGRLYGRGAADNKSGLAAHLAAVRALGDCPLGIKVLVEGEEESGGAGIEEYVVAHAELFAADVIVINDLGNVELRRPTLTTSLRGVVSVDVEVKTLQAPAHSGFLGGPAPDALMALSRMLSTLHDEAGNVAVQGFGNESYTGDEWPERAYRAAAGVLPEVGLVGSGTIAERVFTKPAINVTGLDAPPVAGAVNALVPAARARVSARLAPGGDPLAAQRALARHLDFVVPWGARVTIDFGAAASGFAADTTGPAYAEAAAALREAYLTDVVQIGQGGSIPLVAALHETLPAAEIILWGPEEPLCTIHAPNESVDLDELLRCALAEGFLLAALARRSTTSTGGRKRSSRRAE